MEKWKNLKREALLYHLSFIIFHLSTNGHRLSRRKDGNIEIMNRRSLTECLLSAKPV
jgi:hypothetical protein